MRARAPILALLATAALALFAAATSDRSAARGPAGVGLNPIGSFDRPTYVADAPGYPKLLFVVEQPGRIQVLRRGQRLRRPFLDISDRVRTADNEEGLLSVAFPPDYRRSGRFYVYYNDLTGDIQIDEYRRSAPAFANPASRRPLLNITHQPAGNHNGGQLQFHGRELFLGTGDGGSAGDPPNNAQNVGSLLGKLLRITPRRTRSGRPYGTPRTNPFVGAPGRDEIFSTGLRNPWRFSIQETPRGADRILIADVGQRRFEEVNYETLPGANGANFGWDAWEGFEPYVPGCLGGCPNAGTPDPGGTAAPIFAYPRSAAGAHGCTVIGGYVARDPALDALRGRYVYADLCVGDLRSFAPTLTAASDDSSLGLSVSSPTSFGATRNGRLYVASGEGPVYRIAPR
jgi:glucose/arabinose dehydrogenase